MKFNATFQFYYKYMVHEYVYRHFIINNLIFHYEYLAFKNLSIN